jgi:hypothetical protein
MAKEEADATGNEVVDSMGDVIQGTKYALLASLAIAALAWQAN